MNRHLFKNLLAKYICFVLAWMFIGCTAAALLASLFMLIGMMAGEWALLHVVAMLGITAGFGILTACFIALYESLGGTFFQSEVLK